MQVAGRTTSPASTTFSRLASYRSRREYRSACERAGKGERLKIDFASTGTSYSAVIRFSTAEERLYHEAIDLVLDGIDRTRASQSEKDRGASEMLRDWPLKFRNEVLEYLPKGQRLLAATQWPAILGGFRRELAPAGALLVTERELVLIAEEKAPDWSHGDWAKYGDRILLITTFISNCANAIPMRRRALKTVVLCSIR